MKNKYMNMLQESLIDFSKMEKENKTVDDIINFDGKGPLPTHQKVSDVVSVLERFYYNEDNDISNLREDADIANDGENANNTAVGEGPDKEEHPDESTRKDSLGDVVNQTEKAVEPHGKEGQEQGGTDETIMDRTTSTPSAQTEGAEDGIGESLFEDDDLDLPGPRNAPDHEAAGPDNSKRVEKIGQDGTSLGSGEGDLEGDKKIDEGAECENCDEGVTLESLLDEMGEEEDEMTREILKITLEELFRTALIMDNGIWN